ncbi:MAG TPA: glycosyltransferase family 2 protein [Polyangia bacterium]|jgi:GT2 family glycosyltransferase|nr:glycosyltransferase family 2 protein [Polyangia bacterium]
MIAPAPRSAPVRCAIVIVNYNGEAFVAQAVQSALSQTVRRAALEAFPVVVVDNASTDRSLAVLRTFGEEIVLISSLENTGFSGGNNLAFARIPGAESYALLNPDAAADPDWLEELLACAGRHPNWGFVGANIRDSNRPGVLDNVGLCMALDGTVRGRGRGEPDDGRYREERPILLASGCAMLLSGAALSAAGGFDESFFCYCDDVELCLRLNLLGYSGWFAPAARSSHRFSASVGHTFSAFKAYHVERNRYWVVAKCFPWPAIPVALAASAVRYLWSALAVSGNHGPGARAVASTGLYPVVSAVARAHRDAILGLPEVLRHRRVERSRRSLGMAEFLARWRRDYLPMRTAVHLE